LKIEKGVVNGLKYLVGILWANRI